MKKVLVVIFVVFIMLLLVACNNNISDESASTEINENNSINVICNVEQYANISSSELVKLVGEPDYIEKTTTNGFAEFPCVYYEYNNDEKLGEVSFILINDSVVKLVSYNSFPYNNGENTLEYFNLITNKNVAREKTDTSARYRCPTDIVDDFWITNIDNRTDTFSTLQVTYDMFFFEEWYIPLTNVSEESNSLHCSESHILKIKGLLLSVM